MARTLFMNRVARALRALATGTLIALLSIAAFSVLFLVVEVTLRATGGGAPPRSAAAFIWMAENGGKAVEVPQPPLFVTDQHGIQVGYPLTPGTNAEGYRTPPFDEPANGRSTVLFLGDSFTWGETARPYSASYVDRVRTAGYKVINLGVPATGATQYATQAERYIPALRPEVVCLMFFTDNDFELEADIAPGRTRTYITNVGLFYAATPEGVPLSPQQAVARGISTVPWWVTPGIARIVTSSAAGMWTLGQATQPLKPPSDVARTLNHLERVRAACAANGATFQIFLVPTRPASRSPESETAAVMETLRQFPVRAPQAMDESFYRSIPDVHFNNAGHAVMGDMILQWLGATGYAPHPELNPDEASLYLVSEQPTLAEVAEALSLSNAETAQLEQWLRIMDLGNAAMYFRAPLRGPGQGTPAAFLEQLRRVDSFATRDSAAFVEYTEVNWLTEASTYREIVLTGYRNVFQQLGAILDPERTLRLKRIPLDRFAAIRLFHDAVIEKIDAPKFTDRKYPWELFRDSLGLNAEQEQAIRRELDALQDDLADVFSRRAADGGPSPIEKLNTALAASEGEAPRQRQAMFDYAATRREAVEGQPYMGIFEKKALARQQAIFGALSLDQQTAYTGLPIDNFTKIETGYDAFSKRLEQPLEHPRATAGAAGFTWARFKASLNLRADQEAAVKTILTRLREECAAPGADISTSEQAAQTELSALLDDSQKRRLRMLKLGPLHEVGE